MKNIIISICAALILVACGDEKKGSMLVTGEIKGLKKGTLYLQKMRDTLLVSVDSVKLDGISTFSLSDELESPEIYFLNLDNLTEKRITFFGDKGTINILTKLDKFGFNPTIQGQKNQELLNEYKEMITKFRDKNLDFIKAEFETKGDTTKMDSVQKLAANLLRRRYFYTTNFAVKNSDAEVAPYLALTELYDANIKLLDTINNSLTKEVRASKYGKRLKEFIAEIKEKRE